MDDPPSSAVQTQSATGAGRVYGLVWSFGGLNVLAVVAYSVVLGADAIPLRSFGLTTTRPNRTRQGSRRCLRPLVAGGAVRNSRLRDREELIYCRAAWGTSRWHSCHVGTVGAMLPTILIPTNMARRGARRGLVLIHRGGTSSWEVDCRQSPTFTAQGQRARTLFGASSMRPLESPGLLRWHDVAFHSANIMPCGSTAPRRFRPRLVAGDQAPGLPRQMVDADGRSASGANAAPPGTAARESVERDERLRPLTPLERSLAICSSVSVWRLSDACVLGSRSSALSDILSIRTEKRGPVSPTSVPDARHTEVNADVRARAFARSHFAATVRSG